MYWRVLLLSSYVDYGIITIIFFFFQAEDGIRDIGVTGVQTCALPISPFSARTLRIENISSCLRSVEAPSTPSSSAMATSSAGLCFLSSLRCIWGTRAWCGSFRSAGILAARIAHEEWRANDFGGG